MEPLYVHLAIWLFPVSKPNIQIQIETPFGKRQFHGSFSKYCELCVSRRNRNGLHFWILCHVVNSVISHRNTMIALGLILILSTLASAEYYVE